MKYNKVLTACVLERGSFPLGTLSHVHCCFSTMIYENTTPKVSYESILPLGYLVLDFDKLENNFSRIKRQQTRNSLDFGFIIQLNGIETMILGDLKLNKSSANNPYKDLEKKLTYTTEHVNSLGVRLSDNVYVVYPDNLVDEINEIIKNNLSRRKEEDPEQYVKLNKFKFVTITDIKDEFFN